MQKKKKKRSRGTPSSVVGTLVECLNELLFIPVYVYCIWILYFIISLDDDEKSDKTPSDNFVKVYRRKLCELELILNDIYPPAESFWINEKFTDMGRVPLFVSIIQIITQLLDYVKLIKCD